MYLRIVWGKLRPDSWDEFEDHYYERVAPSNEHFTGMRDHRLLRCSEDPDEGISFSIWDSLEDLANYESSETRRTLAKEVEHLYRGEYWVKKLEFNMGDGQ